MMRSRLLSICLLAATALAACGSSSTARVGIDVPAQVVVLGSSTAFGIGPRDPANGWVALHAAYLATLNRENEVVNLSVPGYTTYQALPDDAAATVGRPAPDPEHNVSAAIARQPSLILLNMPSNDTAAGFSVEEQLVNYERIVGAADAAGIPIWVATPQPRNMDEARRARQRALLDAILERYADRVIDFWSGIAADDGSVRPEYDSGDGIHVNDAAHEIFAQRVRDSSALAHAR